MNPKEEQDLHMREEQGVHSPIGTRIQLNNNFKVKS
jgi:hypothetical protein